MRQMQSPENLVRNQMLALSLLGLMLMTLGTASCTSTQTTNKNKPGSTSTAGTSQHQSNAASAQWPAGTQPLAYVAGQPVTAQDLFPILLNYAGGQALTQVVLDQQLKQKLAQRGLIISPDLIEKERQSLLNELSDDPNQAVRLLKQLKDSRAITNERFNQTLRTNAALRALTRDQVNVTPNDLQLAFDLEYGPKFEVRIITTQTLAQMQQIITQVSNGKSFIDMALTQSTDPSSMQGGLMPPISDADATYPAAVRNMLQRLEPGQVSSPIALDNSYAILKLERKIDGQNVKFVDVKNALTLSVQRQQQQIQMRSLARTLLEGANVVVLDRVLKESWDRQKTMLDQNQ